MRLLGRPLLQAEATLAVGTRGLPPLVPSGRSWASHETTASRESRARGATAAAVESHARAARKADRELTAVSFACRCFLALRQVADGASRAPPGRSRQPARVAAGHAQERRNRETERGACVNVGNVPWRSSSRTARRQLRADDSSPLFTGSSGWE
jgi:hypothetical protein